MPDTRPTAAIYARISLDATGEELGVQRQQDACAQIALDRGWDVVETYVDNSISAFDRSKKRPEYERLRQDHAAGRFGALVVYDLDRLTRQPAQLEEWLEAAERHGLQLATTTGEGDLTTHEGRMFARIKISVARYESEHKAARQRLANLQRAKMGRPQKVGNRPFGFLEDTVAHDPVEADVVRRVFADVIAGVSQREIVRRLDDRGVTTTFGNSWTHSMVRRIVENPRYMGYAHYKGEATVPAPWSPIVDRQTWETANATLVQSRARIAETHTPNRGPRLKYMLSGVPVCGVCGDKMVAGSKRQGKGRPLYRTYQCTRWHNTRRAEPVDQLVKAFVVRLIQRNGLAALPQEDGDDRAELVAEAAVLRRRQEQLVVDYADGVLTRSELQAAKDRITGHLEGISRRLAAADGAAVLAPVLGVDDVATAFEALDVARQRGIVEALVTVTLVKSRPGPGFDPEHVVIRPRRGG